MKCHLQCVKEWGMQKETHLLNSILAFAQKVQILICFALIS